MLSSDEFEGRAPGTKGEELTVKYLEDEFKKLGLKPGNTDGTYIQKVPLVGITATPTQPLTITQGRREAGHQVERRGGGVDEARRRQRRRSSDSDLIFAGYGVEAPEFNWDDFKGVDVKGKTIVVLVNDPRGARIRRIPAKLDPKTFGGNAMTYYGRWTYKFEEGARKGAAGVLIVHETGPAGYPFSVVQGNLSEKFDLVTPDKNMGRAAIEGWITLDAAKKILKMAGQDFDALKKQAATRDFKPVPLGLKASLAIKNTLRTIDSRNVVAKLEGSDPALKDEYVVYTAHWDHLGVGAPVNGDKIYNGALDNASGVATRARDRARVHAGAAAAEALDPVPDGHRRGAGAARLAVLRDHAALSARRRRSPTSTSTASTSGAGRRTSRSSGSARRTSTTTCATPRPSRAARCAPDPEPEKGFYYRSDHFNFAKQGVPALDPDAGDRLHRQAGGLRQAEARRVHEARLPRAVRRGEAGLGSDRRGRGRGAAVRGRLPRRERGQVPEWKPGNEFKAKRDAMMKLAQLSSAATDVDQLMCGRS